MGDYAEAKIKACATCGAIWVNEPGAECIHCGGVLRGSVLDEQSEGEGGRMGAKGQRTIVEILPAKNGQFYFRVKAANGRIVASSETYTRRLSAIRGGKRVLSARGCDSIEQMVDSIGTVTLVGRVQNPTGESAPALRKALDDVGRRFSMPGRR